MNVPRRPQLPPGTRIRVTSYAVHRATRPTSTSIVPPLSTRAELYVDLTRGQIIEQDPCHRRTDSLPDPNPPTDRQKAAACGRREHRTKFGRLQHRIGDEPRQAFDIDLPRSRM